MRYKLISLETPELLTQVKKVLASMIAPGASAIIRDNTSADNFPAVCEYMYRSKNTRLLFTRIRELTSDHPSHLLSSMSEIMTNNQDLFHHALLFNKVEKMYRENFNHILRHPIIKKLLPKVNQKLATHEIELNSTSKFDRSLLYNTDYLHVLLNEIYLRPGTFIALYPNIVDFFKLTARIRESVFADTLTETLTKLPVERRAIIIRIIDSWDL